MSDSLEQTEDKIFLVLEYCAGGDVADYLHRQGIRGRVSEDVARHFLRQLGMFVPSTFIKCLFL